MQVIDFEFNNKTYQGYHGDTLASALLANGVSLTARSFKYHRPRGIMSCGVEEPCSFVELADHPQAANQPITTVKITPGLKARSVNCWPSPDFDLLAINQGFSRLLPAAFYYKTFMWPNWRLYEPHIRRAAGLAAAPAIDGNESRFETRHGHCDVLIAGAGPSGLMAALTAAKSGARVILAEMQSQTGGSLLNRNLKINHQPAIDWIASVTRALSQHDNVTLLHNTTVWAYREHNLLMLSQRIDSEHLCLRNWRIRAGQVIIATGALERPLVFPDNDRPGIMLAGAVQAYINRYAVRPGNRAVVFTNNNSTDSVVQDMMANGIEIAGVVDSREHIDKYRFNNTNNLAIYHHHTIVKAHGHKRVSAVTLQSRTDGRTIKLDCDLVCVSGGWNPVVHLHSQSRGSVKYDDRLAAFIADKTAQPGFCIGGAGGEFNLRQLLDDAAHAGARAAQSRGYSCSVLPCPDIEDVRPYHIEPLWHVKQQRLNEKSFIDLHNDVTLSDLHLAIREGFSAVEHAKRYTTTGMGIDQGKTGNINAIGAIAQQSGTTMDEVGTTTFRSPYVPVEFGAMAGIREESVVLPYRHTALTAWHRNHGAKMYEAGARWQRPGYYAKAGESFQQTVDRESRTVRRGVGVYDGSPLGKFEIKGPDSLKLLNMLYTNAFDSLEDRTGRYGLMLSDDGLILDDGVCFKLADHHYLMTTSTGHADEVYRHMTHFLQVERPHWNVKITPVTSQWSNATLCGPKSRAVLQALGTEIDISNQSFPFMTMRTGTVAGIDARICRVSFTGELSYEINVYTRNALSLWEQIMLAGRHHDIAPIGSEANHVLRVEKGFLSLGHEVDGTVDPYDLGMGWIMSKKKIDYIGKRAVDIRRNGRKNPRQLVGLLIDDPGRLVTEGAPITPGGKRDASEGLVTACVYSVVRECCVALALLENGRERIGQKAHIRLKQEVVTAKIVAPCFHDPDGELLRS